MADLPFFYYFFSFLELLFTASPGGNNMKDKNFPCICLGPIPLGILCAKVSKITKENANNA